MRKEDRDLWEAMIQGVRDDFTEVVESSGMALATDPFFMALLLAQQKIIKRLQAELKVLGVKVPDSEAGTMTTLDA
jgi:hypothetical protein